MTVPLSLLSFAAFGFTLITLTACTGKTPIESAMSDYEKRLARVLEIDVNTASKNRLASSSFPSKQSLSVNIPPLDINLREFYSIKHCQLAAMVAQRNTALGKMQLPSQRFIYEYTLLQTFDSCIQGVQHTNPTLADRLNELKQAKQASYHLSWLNLIQQSEETYSALTRKSKYVSADGEEQYQRSLAAWHYLVSLQTSPNGDIQPIQLESHLQHISKNRLPASLWATERYMQSHFSVINDTLADAFFQLDCEQAADKKKAEILKNVFILFFVEKIQPIGAKVNQIHYQLSPIFESFSASQLSPELQKAIGKRMNDDFQTYQTSSLAHIKLWQSLFKRCNLTN